MIWQFSLPGPRRFSLVMYSHDDFSNGVPTETRQCGRRGSDPSALRVSHESRKIALKYYQKLEPCMSPSTSYIDFQIDTVSVALKTFWECLDIYPAIYPIPYNHALLNFSKGDLGRIQTLTLTITVGWYTELEVSSRFFLWCQEWFRFFSGLNELILEIHEDLSIYPYYYGEMEKFQQELVDIWEEGMKKRAAFKARQGLLWGPPNFRTDIHH